MVPDAYKYALPLIVAAGLVGWLASAIFAVVPLALAAFFLWFFRDPERTIPDVPRAVVSPADGKVTDVSLVTVGDRPYKRISIFLNVFDVHVNRSPVAGVIREIRYQHGKFLNAMGADCAEQNEQNIVTVEDERGEKIVFKQIAGLLARRIVFTKKVGDFLHRGERVGMIKFGSRTDLLVDADAALQVKVGDHVKGGSTVLAYLQAQSEVLSGASAATTRKAT
jgi:phosphatidylserine decarboxylase